MSSSLSKEKLVELLYLLMRDATPTGEIVRIIRMVKQSVEDDQNMYTSKELEAYSRRLADELLT